MKKRIISVFLALSLVISLCACETAPPPPEETPEPTRQLAFEPVGALGRWLQRAQDRYNLNYESFSDYWCLICDEYFGESMHTLLELIASCENTAYKLDEQNEQIIDKRMEYLKRGGDDWRFEITQHSEQALDDTACVNFSNELQHLCELIRTVTDKASDWSEGEWADFASSLGCDEQSAKEIIGAYTEIAEKCDGVPVSSAAEIELCVTFSDGTEITDSTSIYEIGGEYVSTELIDAASLLIQLIYF